MQQYQSAGQIDPRSTPNNDTVNRVSRQAEIFRLTRNSKSKLASASQKAQKTPDGKSTQTDVRRRSKTLDGASPSPRPIETPSSTRPRSGSRSGSRRSSITSISSASSIGSTPSITSPRARIPRISSVNSIAEELDDSSFDSATLASTGQFQPAQTQPTPIQNPHHQYQLQSQYQQMQEQQLREQQRLHQQHLLQRQRFQQQQLQQHAQHQQVQQQPFPDAPFGTGLNAAVQFSEPVLADPKSADVSGMASSATMTADSQPGLQQPFELRSEMKAKTPAENVLEESSHQRSTQKQHHRRTSSNSSGRQSAAERARSLSFRVDDESLPQEPSTPPPLRRVMPQTPERRLEPSANDGANLSSHFAHSPGRGTPRGTPRTPDFNMSDYSHFQTPSPARGGSLTPHRVRWGSLNSALFNQSTNNANSLAPPVPNFMHPAGSGPESTDN